MKFFCAIILVSLLAGCSTKKEVRSRRPLQVSGTTVSAKEMPHIRTPETVKAYPVGRDTDPNFPDEMHERHTLYRWEQDADWNYAPRSPIRFSLGQLWLSPILRRLTTND